MAKVNTIANNGLTIVENYNKLLEQFRRYCQEFFANSSLTK